jgi:hypothetical protein
MFYVYILRYPDGRPFYVGKGSGGRVRKHLKQSDRPLVRQIIEELKLANSQPVVDVVFESQVEAEAFEQEIRLISQFGRRDRGTGILVNRTDGGDGIVGREVTAETRALLRDIFKARVTAEFRAEQAERTRRTWTAERRAKQAAWLAARWQRDSGYADKVRGCARANAWALRTEQTRQAAAAALATAESRARASRKQAENWQDPEYRARMSEKRREQWADPAQRAHLIEAQNAGKARRRMGL